MAGNLNLVGNAMFYKKGEWVNISDEEKEYCFFVLIDALVKNILKKHNLLTLKEQIKYLL